MNIKGELYQTTLLEYKDILSVEDVKEILGIGRNKVYELIESKQLYAVRPGQAYRISKLSLIEYVTGKNAE